MGCDYYTWHETHILFTDPSGVEVKFVIKDDNKWGHHAYERNYDPDFEDAHPFDQQMRQDIAFYGKKELYHHKYGWSCNLNGKLRIERILAGYLLPVGTLKQVYKVLNGYWCDYSQKDWFDGLRGTFSGVLIVKDPSGELLWDGLSDDQRNDDDSVGSG